MAPRGGVSRRVSMGTDRCESRASGRGACRHGRPTLGRVPCGAGGARGSKGWTWSAILGRGAVATPVLVPFQHPRGPGRRDRPRPGGLPASWRLRGTAGAERRMSAHDRFFDRAAIEDAFRRLADRLHRRGVTADLYVFGGAAMALAYDARRATRDIDAV